MSTGLKLVIFDVDGTLVDSQGDILAAMAAAFDAVDLPMPTREVVLSGVGLSLDVLFARLVPEVGAAVQARMAEAYKDAYMTLRVTRGTAESSPLYPGAIATLQRLRAMPEVLIGVATGKSKRGLDKLIEGHGLEGVFLTQQVADFHPSKPHPSMVLAAMAEMGVTPQQTTMVGDTSFDMDMARAAGVRGIGVSWGYHKPQLLHHAHQVIDQFDALDAALAELWSIPA